MAKLTKRCVDGLLPGANDYFVWDDELKGLGVGVLWITFSLFMPWYYGLLQ